MEKFFNFINSAESDNAELYISGDICDNDSKEILEAWGVECTAPRGFKEELAKCNGKPLTVYIDSYGGDVMAASSIYTMLREYKGNITIKIDSIAASAASVIAMAGDKVLMAPTAFLMIHDPATIAWGNITEVKQALDTLKAIKEGIINAYERKCGDKASREKISKLMTEETWLDYNSALEYGFVDGEIGVEKSIIPQEVINSIKNQRMVIYNKIKPQNEAVPPAGNNVGKADKEHEESPVEPQINDEAEELELRKRVALLQRF